MNRRQYLSLAGVTALAGCLGLGGDDDSGDFETDTSSPTAVVESWYPIFVEGSLDTQQEQGNYADNEFDGIESEVVNEGLSKEEIQRDGGIFVGDELATQIANEQEAVRVEATYTITTEGGFDGEQSVTLIVVTEGGEWQILREILDI